MTKQYLRTFLFLLTIALLTGCGSSDDGDAASSDAQGGADAVTAPADAADDTQASAADVGEAPPLDPNSAYAPPTVDGGDGFWEFFRADVVHPIEIRMTTEEWEGVSQDMLDYRSIDGQMRTGNYRRATFVYRDTIIEDVGFRTRGNTTRVVPQLPDGTLHRAHFKIRFNEEFDLPEDSPEYAERNERRFEGLRALNLKWAMEDDPTLIREMFSYDLFRQVGVHAPLTTPVALTVTVDGEPIYFGLYTAIEPIDKSFLRRRHGRDGNDGDLYKCLWQHEGPATLEPFANERVYGCKDWETNYRPAYDLKTNERTSDHGALIDFVDKLNGLTDAELEAYLEANFDVERLLRAVAMNVLIGMPDDYWAMGNNYYLYFHNAGPVEFIPYDYDQCLGGGWDGGPWGYHGIATADIHEWYNLNDAFGWPSGHPLVDRILANPTYRARYDAHLAAMIHPDGGPFVHARFVALWERQLALYEPWLANDMGEADFMAGEHFVEAYFAKKTASIVEQLQLDPAEYGIGE